MHSDQRFFMHLTQSRRKRLEFLRDLNPDREIAVVPCRRPGCRGVVERESRRGPSRWFCHRTCAMEFRRRRRALDDAIDELAYLYQSGNLDWEGRNATESDMRWLLGVRSAYFAPSDWTNATGDLVRDSSASLPALIETWRRTSRHPDRNLEECPACYGTGRLTVDAQDVPRGPAEAQLRKARLGSLMSRIIEELLFTEPQMVDEQWFRVLRRWAEEQHAKLHKLVGAMENSASGEPPMPSVLEPMDTPLYAPTPRPEADRYGR
jgi:hypothetical protein